MAEQQYASSDVQKTYTRFDLSQRVEHFIFLLSFSLLAITGLPQKYSLAPLSEFVLQAFGGIEIARQIHHISAVVMLISSGYHILSLLYRVYVLRVRWTMMPVIEDFKHLVYDVKYYLGRKKHKAYYGRYNYAEKAEYLAVVWGTVVMAITGFMMWNPLVTTRVLSGESIPAAKAAHGGEAVLAVLAIILWHFYHVHVRHFNKSMFTGELSEEEMKHEHPAELDQIKEGNIDQLPPPDVLRSRQRVFFPTAAVLTVVFGVGILQFLTIEDTAIETIPPGETAQVFVPVTPTPMPSPTLAPSPTPAAGVVANSWEGSISALFRNRCSTCHGQTNVGGLSLASYEDALRGGNSGAGITPGDPDASAVIRIQQAGGHPGQLTDAELLLVIEWIEAGAPER